MKLPIRKPLGLVILAGVSLVTPTFAVVSMDYVPVRNAGNAPDSTGYGAVGYDYNIGKYEVTNAQYAEFLNATATTDTYGLYHPNMTSIGIAQSGTSGSYTYAATSGFENKPVVIVSWFDAARFTNWLHNGQGAGDTETGAYTLNGAFTGTILKNAGAAVWIPSEDEWYKAAYYNGGNSTYSLYPNGADTITSADANYGGTGIADVGSYPGDPSFYGTFDQGGNVWEWNDAIDDGSFGIPDSRGLRGGSSSTGEAFMQSTVRLGIPGSLEGSAVGLRVASIPEPTSFLLSMLAGGVMLIRRKR